MAFPLFPYEILSVDVIDVFDKHEVDLDTNVCKIRLNKDGQIFGTEYSSLNYLKHIPIDFIKLNMSFIHGIGENEKDEAIILALVELCKNCNIELIAEGVQTKQQYEFLYKYDVRHMQGYYFYKPMLAKEFEELYFDINV